MYSSLPGIDAILSRPAVQPIQAGGGTWNAVGQYCTQPEARDRLRRPTLGQQCSGERRIGRKNSAKDIAWRFPPIRVTAPMSSQRKTAPCAHPARRKDDSFRQVSWLAGLRSSPPSQTLRCKGQWHFGEGLAADSCGGSFGIDLPKANRTEFPFGRPTRPAHLNGSIGYASIDRCQRKSGDHSVWSHTSCGPVASQQHVSRPDKP
jgi:hypothetical protein